MKYIMAFGVMLLLLGVIGNEDYNGALADHRHYCEMVSLWEASGGQNGHPDYNSRGCKNY